MNLRTLVWITVITCLVVDYVFSGELSAFITVLELPLLTPHMTFLGFLWYCHLT